MALTTEVPQPKPTPGEPLMIHFTGLYTMFYRKDTNALQSKNFRLNGGLRQARERAEKHCTIIGGKLMFVQPLICDLQKEEDYILHGRIEVPLAPEEKKV